MSHDAAPATPPPTPPGAPRVLLLTTWLDAGGAWRARVVTSDAQAHDFTSPFLLAQFLARPQRCARPRGDGLR